MHTRIEYNQYTFYRGIFRHRIVKLAKEIADAYMKSMS